jgi:DNA-binding NarL/FixJ family response regulator
MIRLVLADDHELIRLSVTELVAAQPDMELVGTAVDGASAVSVAVRAVPDVVLMDLSMPRLDGLAATTQILHMKPGIRVVVFTAYLEETVVKEAIAAGACGYVLKGSSAAELLEAVRSAYRGEQAVSSVLRRLLGS